MQENNMEILSANHSDIDMIVDLRTQFADELSGKQTVTVEQNLRQNLKEYLTEELNKSCICSYAKSNETVVSIAVMAFRRQPGNAKNPTGKWGYIMNVYTLPQYRKKGISTMVLKAIINSATNRGIFSFELHATKEGEPVYQKMGFAKHAEPTYHLFEK